MLTLKNPPSLAKIIDAMKNTIRYETANMIDIHPSEEKDNLIIEIVEASDLLLNQIKKSPSWTAVRPEAGHSGHSPAMPTIDIACHETDFPKAFYGKALRIGVYPIYANPIHWGHVLTALSAMAYYTLDKVVFTVAGDNPRTPHLAPCQWRHQTAQGLLSKFNSLLAYSDIGKNNHKDAANNLFKFLSLNPFQKIDAFLIAGRDHHDGLSSAAADEETIQKLQNHITQRTYEFNPIMHSVSLIFAKPGSDFVIPSSTHLNISFIPSLAFEASSTLIQEAWNNPAKSFRLGLLPYSVYQSILSLKNPAYQQ